MLTWQDGQILDSQVGKLVDFLQEGDVLVLNDARVIKAKLSAKILRNSVRLYLNLDQKIGDLWQALCHPAKKVKVGDELEIASDFFAEVVGRADDGFISIRFGYSDEELFAKLEKYGSVPLPPYIKRDKKNSEDQKNYQTIYAANGVAAAAPTAGLHFSEEIFSALEAKKIQKTFVTLNVGAGTFLPVRGDFLTDHKMHSEFFCLSQESAKIINSAKAAGKKIVAVGTTSLRVLESAVSDDGLVKAMSSRTEIFIYPPYKFKIVDVLITNFHLPRSTLFMLVCAFVGRENAFKLYNHAISQNYRFYSYGDVTLLKNL